MATLNTDSAGVALFQGVAIGQYTVNVFPPMGFDDVPDAQVNVSGGATANVEFVLPQSVGDVRVVVKRADGSTIQGVRVDLEVVVP